MNLKISVLVIKTNIFNNFRIFKHLKNLKKGGVFDRLWNRDIQALSTYI